LYLPTSEEIIEELLREYGVESLPDEKRRSYLPIIKRFGGLHHAAAAFSGSSGKILMALQNETKTIGEMQGACKLKGSDLPGKSNFEHLEEFLIHESDRMKRVAMSRFRRYARHSMPENVKLRSLLEFWVNRSILFREWMLGPCSQCGLKYYERHLRIHRRVLCPTCGNQISMPGKVPIGYSLQKPVRRAIKEGIMPVVLTARFLRNMSTNGFFSLPGVKYQVGAELGDIDLIACCDGYLTYCECKCLEETSPCAKLWDQIVSHFIETAKIAQKYKEYFVLLA
jgi:hypothetical protein